MAFGSIAGTPSGTIDVGAGPDDKIWFRVHPALQFARGLGSGPFARQKLAATIQGDGIPDGFRRGLWKEGNAAAREGGQGSHGASSFPTSKTLS